MKRRWLVPLCLLAVLLAAYALRWGEEGSQALGGGRVTYTRDRWTGRLWVRVYSVGVDRVQPVPKTGEKLEDAAEAVRRDDLAFYWQVAVFVVVVWLLRALGWLRISAAWRERMRRWTPEPFTPYDRAPAAEKAGSPATGPIPLPPSRL